MKIDPYIFPMMSMIISDGKEHAENTGKKPDLVGLSENPPQKHKKSIFSKIAKEICLILKICTTQYAWMLYLARGDLLFPHYLVSSSNGVHTTNPPHQQCSPWLNCSSPWYLRTYSIHHDIIRLGSLYWLPGQISSRAKPSTHILSRD